MQNLLHCSLARFQKRRSVLVASFLKNLTIYDFSKSQMFRLPITFKLGTSSYLNLFNTLAKMVSSWSWRGIFGKDIYFENKFTLLLRFLFFALCYWSSLKNYKSNSTSQHNTTRVQHDKTPAQHDTTRGNTSNTQANTRKIRYNASMTLPNASTKEARAAKIGLYFTFFVIELYIFLIFFRNG